MYFQFSRTDYFYYERGDKYFAPIHGITDCNLSANSNLYYNIHDTCAYYADTFDGPVTVRYIHVSLYNF